VPLAQLPWLLCLQLATAITTPCRAIPTNKATLPAPAAVCPAGGTVRDELRRIDPVVGHQVRLVQLQRMRCLQPTTPLAAPRAPTLAPATTLAGALVATTLAIPTTAALAAALAADAAVATAGAAVPAVLRYIVQVVGREVRLDLWNMRRLLRLQHAPPTIAAAADAPATNTAPTITTALWASRLPRSGSVGRPRHRQRTRWLRDLARRNHL